AGEAETVGRRRAHRHPAVVHLERTGEAGAHLAADGVDARLLCDEHAVGVHELPTGFANLPVRRPKEIERGRAAVLLIAGGESRPDVAQVGRTEYGVDESVRDDVPVGVTREAGRMVDRDASQ